MTGEQAAFKAPRWGLIIVVTLGIFGTVFASVVLWILVPVFGSLGEHTFQEVESVPRPSSSGERAVIYREFDGQGAVGATYSAVYVMSRVDTIPGRSGGPVWRGKRMDLVRVRWRDHDHLEVHVRSNTGYERYKGTISEAPSPGLAVTTIVAPDTGAYR